MFRVLFFVITLSFATVFAQDQSNRELLHRLSEKEKIELRDRYALDLARLEYFAKPGRIEVYSFSTAVLEIEGGTLTLTPFDDLSVEILSHRMWRGPNGNRGIASWRGTGTRLK